MEETQTYSLNIGGRLLELRQPLVMAILNATPDSFYADSRRQDEEATARRARQFVDEGAAIIDIGAYSTRPGHTDVPLEEELARLRMAVGAVRRVAPDIPLSIDTFRPNVVARLFDEFGAFIVNDISGGTDPDMFPTVARLGLPYVLTHNPLPAPAVPFSLPAVLLFLSERIASLRALGQKDIILDPGFGFGKSLEENYALLSQLSVLHAFGLPLLVGGSRKSMIYRLLDTTPDKALNGTTVLHTLALQQGAHILRAHDVQPAIEAIKLVQKCSSPSA